MTAGGTEEGEKGPAGGPVRYASLKDVARQAGVSFQTAGKVLSNRPVKVSPATRQRIIASARRLDYVANPAARSLVTRSTATIGIIGDDQADWSLAQFVLGAEQVARHAGHAVLISHTGRSAGGAATVRSLLERRVDGIVTAAPQLEEDEAVAAILRRHPGAVSLHHVPGGGVPRVGSDHRRTGALAVEHLLGLGHRRIGTVTGPLRRRVSRSRLRGYEDSLRAGGVAVACDVVEEADWTAAGAAVATRRLLQRAPELTAVFAQSDLMALGVISALSEMGRRVPEDVSVVGCDDLPFVAHLRPPLTSVHIPFSETATCAVELVLRRIAGEVVAAEPVLLPVHLVTRASCGPPAPTGS